MISSLWQDLRVLRIGECINKRGPDRMKQQDERWQGACAEFGLVGAFWGCDTKTPERLVKTFWCHRGEGGNLDHSRGVRIDVNVIRDRFLWPSPLQIFRVSDAWASFPGRPGPD